MTSRHELLLHAEESSLREDPLVFDVGDTVNVHTRILEGDKERVQVFTGVVIARRGGGTRETFTVRRIVTGEGVELPARLLEDIEALEHGVIEGAGQRAIAARLETSQQLVSHHLRMMEKQGWIIRHGRGRRKVIGLTEHGIEALSESRTAMLTNRPSHNP